MNSLTIFIKLLFNSKRRGSLLNFIVIFQEIFIQKEYKIKADLKHKVVLDIGANIGLFSLWMNSQYENLNLYLFEPDPTTFQILKRNIPTATINQLALSNKEETAILTSYSYASGFNSLDPGVNQKTNNMKWPLSMFINWITKEQKQHRVHTQRMDHYLTQNNIPHIGLCKIDVEGLELAVLEGFGEAIDKVDHFIIEIETFRGNTASIYKLLHNFHSTPLKTMPNCQVVHFWKK